MTVRNQMCIGIAAVLAVAIACGEGLARGRSSGRSASRNGRGTVRHSGRSSTSVSRRRTSTSARRRTTTARRTTTSARRRTTTARRPANYGSIRHSSTSRTTVRGRYGTGEPTKRTAEGPRGGELTVGRGSGGARGAHLEGPGGGERTVVRGPRGRTARHGEGPGGREAAAVRGRYGRGAVAVRGPHGGEALAVKGPYGRGAVARLPGGSVRVRVGGSHYYRYGHVYYRPYYYGGTLIYVQIPAPVDTYIYTLPAGYTVVVINGNRYYYYNGVYYITKMRQSRTVYVVVEAPETVVTKTVVVADVPPAPDPFKILRSMSAYLSKQRELSLVAHITSDEVTDAGQKLQLSSQRIVKISRPDRVSVEMRGDQLDKRVVYDGKTLTFLDRSQRLYGVLSMPETIDEMLESLSKNYGMTLPLADLFYTDTYKVLTERVEAGQYVGLHKVGNIACHHLAFTQDVIDWEIWIQADSKPVPRKLVITYKTQPGTPRYTVEMPAWDTSPMILPDAFKLVVPADAARIEVLPVAPSTEAS